MPTPAISPGSPSFLSLAASICSTPPPLIPSFHQPVVGAGPVAPQHCGARLPPPLPVSASPRGRGRERGPSQDVASGAGRGEEPRAVGRSGACGRLAGGSGEMVGQSQALSSAARHKGSGKGGRNSTGGAAKFRPSLSQSTTRALRLARRCPWTRGSSGRLRRRPDEGSRRSSHK